MSRTSNNNNTVAQAQAQARLNFTQMNEQPISDMNTVLESIRQYKISEKTLKDAQDAYEGDKKSEDFRNYIRPYREDVKPLKDKADAQARKFIAFYGTDRQSLSFDTSDCYIDINAFLQNTGVLIGDIKDVTKDKQLATIKSLMDTITGRVSCSVTKQAKGNNVLKFGRVKVVKDNAIDTILMLEVGLSAYTVIKSYYVGKDGQATQDGQYVKIDDKGVILTQNRQNARRVLINTIKTPVK